MRLAHSRITLLGAALALAAAFAATAWRPDAVAAQGAGRKLRAGAAITNITPPLDSSINGGFRDGRAAYIHDDLHVRSLVLDDGVTTLALAVVDSCMLPREVVESARRAIRIATGLPASRILISATHSHSCGTVAPIFQSEPDPEYARFVARRIADGVRIATANLAPAWVGSGVGSVPEEVFNRRWKMKPGSIPLNPFGGQDQVRMNPPPGDKNLLEPAGPVDPELHVLSVLAGDEKPIALLGNYSLHYVGGVGPGHISADYFGLFAKQVEQMSYPESREQPVVAMMSNGTSGDINNINFRQPRAGAPAYAQIRRVADRVAGEAVRVRSRIGRRNDITLAAAEEVIRLGVRRPSAAEVAEAREILSGAAGKALTTPREVYANETVRLADYPDEVPVTLQALRIGDLAIMAIPCEVFVEIGLELKARSAIQPAFVISLANGYNGYLPTPEHHALGGYETWRARSSYLEVDASPKIVSRLLALVEKLKP